MQLAVGENVGDHGCAMGGRRDHRLRARNASWLRIILQFCRRFSADDQRARALAVKAVAFSSKNW